MKLAGISVDVDSVASHLRGYGISDPARDEKAYTVALPRALEIFAISGIKATFFVIVEEAENHPELLREILREGHEIACHSLTHPVPFDISDPENSNREIQESKTRLEDACGSQVFGFRAPSYYCSEPLLEALKSAGYRYDASLFPSWMLAVLRHQVSKLGGFEGEGVFSSMRNIFLPGEPHKTRSGIIEIPLTTTRWGQIPYYHTFRYLLSPAWASLIASFAAKRTGPINYLFHAVDFLGFWEDVLDSRIQKHPGMGLNLEDKIALVQTALADLIKDRSGVTLNTIAGRV